MQTNEEIDQKFRENQFHLESMKNTHTPGPWKHEREMILAPMKGMNFAEFTTKDGYHQILDRSEKWLTMGIQPWVQFAPPEWTEMQEANARLIASAPELLEALEKLDNAFTISNRNYPDWIPTLEMNVAFEQIQSIISKAKGL